MPRSLYDRFCSALLITIFPSCGSCSLFAESLNIAYPSVDLDIGNIFIAQRKSDLMFFGNRRYSFCLICAVRQKGAIG